MFSKKCLRKKIIMVSIAFSLVISSPLTWSKSLATGEESNTKEAFNKKIKAIVNNLLKANDGISRNFIKDSLNNMGYKGEQVDSILDGMKIDFVEQAKFRGIWYLKENRNISENKLADFLKNAYKFTESESKAGAKLAFGSKTESINQSDDDDIIDYPSLEEPIIEDVYIKGKISSQSGIFVRDSIGGNKLGILGYNHYVEGRLVGSGYWLEIQYNGRKAYIAKAFVQERGETSEEIVNYNIRGYISSKNGLYVRNAIGGDTIGVIDYRTEVLGREVAGGYWFEFYYNGQKAYVAREFVESIDGQSSSDMYEGYVSSKAGLLVRDDISGDKIGILNYGDHVKGRTVGGGYWLEINFESTRAYIAKAFVDEYTGPKPKLARVDSTVGLLMRDDIDGDILGTIDYNTEIYGKLVADGYWFEYYYNGQKVYSASYWIDILN